jgi:serine/threonine protein kinase
MDCIEKEVRLHNMVQSNHAVRLYNTIKTNSNIYMMQEFCNGFDLAVLLKLKKQLSQLEVSLIIS